MAEHTPTPWYVVRMRGYSSPVIGRRPQGEADLVSGDIPVATLLDKAPHWTNSFPVEANAAFIVNAVNNHERLMDILKAVEHTLTVHGHIDAGTPLHDRIIDAVGGVAK